MPAWLNLSPRSVNTSNEAFRSKDSRLQVEALYEPSLTCTFRDFICW